MEPPSASPLDHRPDDLDRDVELDGVRDEYCNGEHHTDGVVQPARDNNESLLSLLICIVFVKMLNKLFLIIISRHIGLDLILTFKFGRPHET